MKDDGPDIVCARCNTPVVFKDVSPGYYAVCPEHDEDLYQMETVCLSCGNELCSCNDPDNRWQSSEYDDKFLDNDVPDTQVSRSL
jgi:hypothetical protein